MKTEPRIKKKWVLLAGVLVVGYGFSGAGSKPAVSPPHLDNIIESFENAKDGTVLVERIIR